MKNQITKIVTKSESKAWSICKNLNNNKKNEIFAIVDFSEYYAVVDLNTAIDLGLGYFVKTF
jgi:hypothetical protein